VNQGITAYKEGQTVEAQQLLMQAVELDERNEKAWLWLSGAVDCDEDRLICLENVLAINPDNAAARKGLAHLQTNGTHVNEPTPPSAEPQAEQEIADSLPLAPKAEGNTSGHAESDTSVQNWTEEPLPEKAESDPPPPPWAEVETSGIDESASSAHSASEESFQGDAQPDHPSPPWEEVETSETDESASSAHDVSEESFQGDALLDHPPPPWEEADELDASQPDLSTPDIAPAALSEQAEPEGQPSPWDEPESASAGSIDIAKLYWAGPGSGEDAATADSGQDWIYVETQEATTSSGRPGTEEPPVQQPESGPAGKVQTKASAATVRAPGKGSRTAAPSKSKPSSATVKASDRKKNTDTLLLLGAVGFLLLVIMVSAAVYIIPRLLAPNASQTSESLAPDPSQAVLAVLTENLAAYNVEDIDRYMNTIHSSSPGYHQTRDAMQEMSGIFDLTARWDKAQVEEISQREARVSFSLTTRKLAGPAFRDNRIDGVMILRPQDGQWKIYNQVVDNVEYLN
jgi:hypothetical protein